MRKSNQRINPLILIDTLATITGIITLGTKALSQEEKNAFGIA